MSDQISVGTSYTSVKIDKRKFLDFIISLENLRRTLHYEKNRSCMVLRKAPWYKSLFSAPKQVEYEEENFYLHTFDDEDDYCLTEGQLRLHRIEKIVSDLHEVTKHLENILEIIENSNDGLIYLSSGDAAVILNGLIHLKEHITRSGRHAEEKSYVDGIVVHGLLYNSIFYPKGIKDFA